MTKLEAELTRLTGLVVDGREVDVTLAPGNESTRTPPALVLHLKGTQQYKHIPLPAILKAVGWKVQMKKQEREAEKSLGELLDELEITLRPWRSKGKEEVAVGLAANLSKESA